MPDFPFPSSLLDNPDSTSAILKDILSGDDQDIVIERIHDYLRDIAQKVRGNLIPIAKYTIYTVKPPYLESIPSYLISKLTPSIRNYQKTQECTLVVNRCHRSKLR